MNSKLFYSTFLLFSFSLKAQAQTTKYYKMPDSPDSNAQWSIFLNANQDGCEKYLISLIGDTVIQGFKYNKLWMKGAEYFPQNGCDFSMPVRLINKYAGAFREDTTDRKVYFLPESDTVERLLYDFNLKVGDTLRTYNARWCNLTVDRIDSVMIHFNYRKKWIIKNGSCARNVEIIEGIGSNYGLLEEFAQSIGGRHQLGCFSINNKTLFPNFDANSGCPKVNKIRDIESNPLFKIIPNPSSGRFKILSSENFFSIDIMNLFGEIVFESESIYDIDISLSPAGIYYLKLSTDKITLTQKLILN